MNDFKHLNSFITDYGGYGLLLLSQLLHYVMESTSNEWHRMALMMD